MKTTIFFAALPLAIVLTSGAALQLAAQNLDSPLAFDGGADAHLYKHDTVMLENAVLDTGWKTGEADSVATGFHMIYSPYLSMVYLPFRYSPLSWFEVDLTLPFMYKLLINSGSEREKTEFGDIKLGLTFCLAPLEKAVINFRVKLTFPTGDACARDGDLMIPMGYGSFTLSALWSLSSMHLGNDKFGIRFYGNFAVTGYFKAQLEPDSIVRHTIDHSYGLSALGGLEMKIINRLYIQGKLSYIYLPERRYKTENLVTSTKTGWRGLQDSFHAMDIIIALKFDFIPDFSGTLATVIPIYEEQDSGVADPEERRWKIYFSLEKTFGLTRNDPKPQKAAPATRKKAKKSGDSKPAPRKEKSELLY
jgi:hypothetical protein